MSVTALFINNPSTSELVQEAILNDEGTLAENGQLCVNTGLHTGRAADAKYIITAPGINFGPAGKEISIDEFLDKYVKSLTSHTARKYYSVYFVTGPENKPIKGMIQTEFAWQALFAKNLFKEIPPTADLDITIFAVPNCSPEEKPFIACDFNHELDKEAVVIIGGTKYAGEIKKSVFTYLSYILPKQNILPMHSSVTTDKNGENSAVFFGLSGTGKTTLSADQNRLLIGDDEHGWSDDGLFNFEGGCYAKVINLSEEKEPQIWNAVHNFGTVIENVPVKRGKLDFSSKEITENTRAAYPLSAISNVSPHKKAPHPNNIIMLTCDAYGIFPSVAKLTPEQAKYYFLNGYTAKIAGTEKGITEPKATFSACFGAPFMPLDPKVYADMLYEKIIKHNVDVWLVNTGWDGGPYGIGSRIPLDITRSIVNSILDGSMKECSFRNLEPLNLSIPYFVHVNPRIAWQLNSSKFSGNAAENYDNAAKELMEKFAENSKKFGI